MSQFPELPQALRLTPSQRAQAWEGVALRPVSSAIEATSVTRTQHEDAATAAFRAALEQQRKLVTQASIARRKVRIAAKKIDYSKVRWNPRKNRFEDIDPVTPKEVDDMIAASIAAMPADKRPGKLPKVPQARIDAAKGKKAAKPLVAPVATGNPLDLDALVTVASAEAVARRNGVWDDKYAKLSGGLLVMTVRNRLKGKAKRGEKITWA